MLTNVPAKTCCMRSADGRACGAISFVDRKGWVLSPCRP
ncbi:hypothetical protein SS05631_c32660 [Sinorhizobium sp. CCBAU 05631]|nr:hypothetical protein SS05631_c32660 [Sinorhizobium sp. CCBAU 05631]